MTHAATDRVAADLVADRAARDRQAKALDRVWAKRTGGTNLGPYVEQMVRQGWTVTMLESVCDLAEHAHRHNTGAARFARQHQDRFGSTPMELIADRLVGTVTVVREQVGGRRNTALQWVAAAAGAPDLVDEAVKDMAYVTGERRRSGNPLLGSVGIEDWPKAWGPLPWAAGLTVKEARTQAAAGLDVGMLEAMASLRGWRLPASAKP